MLIKLADDGPKAAGAIKCQEAKLWPGLEKVPGHQNLMYQRLLRGLVTSK